MGIRDIVNVTITRETRAVSQQGFGTVLIVGPNPTFDRIKYYSGSTALTDLAADLTGGSAAAEYLAAALLMSQSPKPVMFAVGRKKSGDASYADALAEIQAVDDDWYGVLITSRTQSDVLSAAGWVEASESPKIMGTASAEADLIGKTLAEEVSVPSSTPYKIKALGYVRTFCFYHASAATVYIEAAAFGKVVTQDPGSYTLKFKSFSGVTSDDLNPTQAKNAHDKYCNTYEPVGGVDIVQDGWVSGAEFLDVMIFVDWLQARITERVYSKLVNLPKVPFTDAGVAVIEGEVKAQLQEGIDVGGIASDPAPVVEVPLVADVSDNDKATRTLPDVEFSATLAGAIHFVTVEGKVTV